MWTKRRRCPRRGGSGPFDTLGRRIPAPRSRRPALGDLDKEAYVAEVFHNPTPEQVRGWTEEMPEARRSGFGNVNVQTQVLSRSAGSTFVVDRETSGKSMTRAEYDAIVAAQETYIAANDMIVVDGYIGNDP